MGCSCHEAKCFFTVPLKNVRKVRLRRVDEHHCLLIIFHVSLLYRIVRFSTASAAENFRSTCGPERGPPECSTQASPAAAPQVGQGTTDICSEVSSFFFILTGCENIGCETVQFCTLFASTAAFRKTAAISVVQDDTEEGIVHMDRALVLDKA